MLLFFMRKTVFKSVNYLCLDWIETRKKSLLKEKSSSFRFGTSSPFPFQELRKRSTSLPSPSFQLEIYTTNKQSPTVSLKCQRSALCFQGFSVEAFHCWQLKLWNKVWDYLSGFRTSDLQEHPIPRFFPPNQTNSTILPASNFPKN